jgi:hypothetical protein
VTGKGCLFLIGAFVLLCVLIGSCAEHYGGSDDCYTTGEQGSAQYDRDVQHCIKGDR